MEDAASLFAAHGLIAVVFVVLIEQQLDTPVPAPRHPTTLSLPLRT